MADQILDLLDDFSKTSFHSPTLWIAPGDSNDPNSHVIRGSDDFNVAPGKILIYYAPGAQQLTVVAVMGADSTAGAFKFYTSPNSTSWTEQTNWTTGSGDESYAGGWWIKRSYTFSSLPNGTNFVKVEFKVGGSAYFDPQLDKVTINYTPPSSGNNSLYSITQSPNGNIGIGTGTTPPDSPLTVGGDLHLYRPDGSSLYVQLPASDVRILTVGAKPLLLGSNTNTFQLVLNPNGKVGIGTANPSDTLTVRGSIKADQMIVASVGADFVFADDYKLLPLSEVEQRIKSDRHLPDVQSAAEVKTNGMSVGDMQTKLLQKVEELTLYVIDLKKENEALKTRVATLETK